MALARLPSLVLRTGRGRQPRGAAAAAQVLLTVTRMEHASFWRLALNEARDETDFAVAFQGFSVFAIFS
jgi:hypothetical protein